MSRFCGREFADSARDSSSAAFRSGDSFLVPGIGLEVIHVYRCCSIPPLPHDMTNTIGLRLLTEIADRHVLDHTAAKITDGLDAH